MNRTLIRMLRMVSGRVGFWYQAAAVAALIFTAAAARADSAAFPRPPALEPDVQFWQRIYSKVSTHGGLLHDDRYLNIVYEELTFPAGLSTAERSALIDTVRAHYERVLRYLGAGNRDDLSDDERRVLSLFPANVTDAALAEAAEHVRFQLGQSDRFREGLIRSGVWEKHVEETLRREGLPGELSALPHVESSFNPRAYSKVGAAGLWQFMRSTGKRWLRVDGTVDERLDPYKSTLAAAQFLNINYSILGTWPLALTAWNHGAGGMRRAKDELGTDDITTILRNYQGRTFGFASRNFYVSFLAALEVDRNADRYFGRVDRMPGDDSRTVRLPALVPAQSLEKALGTDRETLRALNLSLLDPIWSGRKPVPRGFELRVPAGVDAGRLLSRLGQSDRAEEPHERLVTVGRADTLDRIATQYGLRTKELADYNHVSARDVHTGMTIRVPALSSLPSPPATPVPETVAAPSAVGEPPNSADGFTSPTPMTSPAPTTHTVSRGESLSGIARKYGVSATSLLEWNGLAQSGLIHQGQRLTLVQPQSASGPDVAATPIPQTVTKGEVTSHSGVSELESRNRKEVVADPVDYSVNGGVITVQASESLSLLAKWCGVSVERLQQINHLKTNSPELLDHSLRLEFSGVESAQFEARRAEFHRANESSFFERHRVTGTARRILASGDTLWTLTQKGKIPVWLLRQYNPDVKLSSLRAGLSINIPQIDEIDRKTSVSSGAQP
jgi:membrane-bound lytic murein transglycosylase D